MEQVSDTADEDNNDKDNNNQLSQFLETWQEEIKRRTQDASKDHGSYQTFEANMPASDTEDTKQAKAKELFMNGVWCEQNGLIYEAMEYYRKATKIIPDIDIQMETQYRQSLIAQNKNETEHEKLYGEAGSECEDISDLCSHFSSMCYSDDEKKVAYCSMERQQRAAHISALPSELLTYILRWIISSDLDVRSLENFSMVCRGFYVLARDIHLWRNVCARTVTVTTLDRLSFSLNENATMNSSRNMDTDMRRRRWKETQKIDLNWQEVLEDNLHAALLSHSLSTGTPIDFHVMPLLTTAASFMNEATVLANEETGWREPSIIWSVVSAPAGSRKSAAMKVFTKAVENIYSTDHTPDLSRSILNDTDSSSTTKPNSRPYMTNSIFTMPSLSSKIEKHNGQFLLMYDEMSLLFKNIDKDSKDSPMRQVFLSMANGDGIVRSTSTAGEEYLSSTNVNFCGFIQPDVLFNQIQRGDPDGFLARMSIVTPRLVSFSYKDFTKPTDSITIEEILRQVKTNHSSPNLEYRFSPEALKIFEAYYDELAANVDRTDVFDETEQRSVQNKMLGQSARICMVMQALTNSAASTSSIVISADTTRRSILLAKYILKHKLALVTDPIADKNTTPSRLLSKEDLLQMSKSISSILTQDKVTARDISSNHRIPNARINNRSRQVITSLAANGFGEMVCGPNGSLGLKRKCLAHMDNDARGLFDELGVDELLYNAAVDNQDSQGRKKARKNL